MTQFISSDDDKNGGSVSPFILINDDFWNIRKYSGTFADKMVDDKCHFANLLNPARPSFHAISCSSVAVHTILCEQPILETSKHTNRKDFTKNFANIFRCSEGILISKAYLCDGLPDCIDSLEDENDCSCTVGSLIILDSGHCSSFCHPANCTCSPLYKQRPTGGCFIYSDSNTRNTGKSSNIESAMHHHCNNKTGPIDVKLVNDLIPDCADNTDEPLMVGMGHSEDLREYRCPELGMVECVPGHSSCFGTNQTCLYDIDGITGTLLFCRNGKHLQICEDVLCDQTLKCPGSYCIPYRYRCNGKWDCWDGFDEQSCTQVTVVCKGLFKCRFTQICVHINDICNGVADCFLEDDELACNVKYCIRECTCLGLGIMCTNVLIDRNMLHSEFTHFLIVHISFISSFKVASFTKAITLILPHNKLQTAFPLSNQEYSNLKIMDMTFNLVEEIILKKNMYLPHVVALNFSYNVLSSFTQFTMHTLHLLDLSHNNIHELSQFSFSGLTNLKILVVHCNILTQVNIALFSTLHAQVILTDKYHMCCFVESQVTCTAKPFWPHMCTGRFSGNTFFKIIFWLVPIIISAVTLPSVIFSFKYISVRAYCRKEAATNFRTVVAALNLSDLMFALHLFAMAIKDATQDKTEVMTYENLWVHSDLCLVLACLSSFAVTLSCLLGVFLSVTRYLAVRSALDNPLTRKRTQLFVVVCTLLSLVFVLTAAFSKHESDYSKHTLTSPLCVLIGDVRNSLVIRRCSVIVVFLLVMSTVSTPFVYIRLAQSARRTKEEIEMKQQKAGTNTIKSLCIYLTVSIVVNTLCCLPAGILLFVLVSGQTFSLIIHCLLLLLSVNPLLNACVLNFSDVKSLISTKLLPICIQENSPT